MQVTVCFRGGSAALQGKQSREVIWRILMKAPSLTRNLRFTLFLSLGLKIFHASTFFRQLLSYISSYPVLGFRVDGKGLEFPQKWGKAKRRERGMGTRALRKARYAWCTWVQQIPLCSLQGFKKKKIVNETDPKRRQLKQTSFSSLTFKIFFFSLPCIGRPKFLSWVLAVLQLTSDSVQLCTLSQFSHLRQILRPKGPLSSSVGHKWKSLSQ